MKKISILGILAILVIVAEFTYAMIAGWVDMKNSFLEGYNSVNVHSGTPQPVSYTHLTLPTTSRV